jgi:hypothetical protein
MAAANFKEDVYDSLKGKPVTVVTNGAIFKEEDLQRCASMNRNPIQECFHVGFERVFRDASAIGERECMYGWKGEVRRGPTS